MVVRIFDYGVKSTVSKLAQRTSNPIVAGSSRAGVTNKTSPSENRSWKGFPYNTTNVSDNQHFWSYHFCINFGTQSLDILYRQEYTCVMDKVTMTKTQDRKEVKQIERSEKKEGPVTRSVCAGSRLFVKYDCKD